MDTARVAALLFLLASTGCTVASASTSTSRANFGEERPSTPAPITIPATALPVTPSPCPTSAPRTGDACADEELVCSWGDDARFGCRTVTRCEGGAWQSVGHVCTQQEPSCPRELPQSPDGSAAVCTDAQVGITCAYDQQAFTCAPCIGTYCRAQNHWQSGALEAGCPATTPNFGEPCVLPNVSCDYNGCAASGAGSLGASMTCAHGYWTENDFICL